MAEERVVNARAAEAPGQNSDADGAASLDQVRDLLFGNQVRESQNRFARLEERFNQELAELRADTKKRLESLEAFLEQELQGFGKRMQD